MKNDITQNYKKIAVLGATGRTGKYLVNELLGAGFDIRILVPNPSAVEHLKDKVEIIHGDAANYQCILDHIQGCHVVISALGPTGLHRRAAKKMICSQTTGNIIKAAAELNIKRYIVVSGAAVALPEDRRNFYGWMSSILVPLFVWHVLKDKKLEAELLQASDMDWTLVRCPEITNSEFKKEPVISLRTPKWLQVRGGELARFLVAQINDNSYIKKGVFITSRF